MSFYPSWFLSLLLLPCPFLEDVFIVCVMRFSPRHQFFLLSVSLSFWLPSTRLLLATAVVIFLLFLLLPLLQLLLLCCCPCCETPCKRAASSSLLHRPLLPIHNQKAESSAFLLQGEKETRMSHINLGRVFERGALSLSL